MDIIANQNVTPSMADIENSITGEGQSLWQALTAHIETEFGAKPLISFSACAAKPGWNVKYKKSGKALCTLYPEKESFTALIVLGAADMMRFEAMCPTLTHEISALYERTRLFNNTKWLMISVTDETVLADIKKLLALKTAKA